MRDTVEMDTPAIFAICFKVIRHTPRSCMFIEYDSLFLRKIKADLRKANAILREIQVKRLRNQCWSSKSKKHILR